MPDPHELWRLAPAATTPPDGDTDDARVAQALLWLRQGDTRRALRACAQLLDDSPGHLGALLVRGEAEARVGDRVGAQSAFRRWVKREPELALGEHLLRSVGGRGFDAPLRGEVQELFDRYAASFDAHLTGELGYRGHELLPAAVAALSGGSRCGVAVDLGCGTGLCGPELRGLAETLVGVDLSPAILEKARERGVYDVLFVADLVLALATSATRSADLLVAADVLGYLGPLEAVSQEARRVLRPGGRFAFTVEAWEGSEAMALGPQRRFAFAEGYLSGLAAAGGWAVERFEAAALRSEAGSPVPGWLVVWRAA